MNKTFKICMTFLILQLLVSTHIMAGHEKGAQEGMVLVQAGKFDFGDEDDEGIEKIDLKAFYIDQYEVTNEQYRNFKHEHKFPPDKADHPVTGVSWHDANTYCKSLGKRLPAEEEWEKAARGTDGRAYPWGKDFKSDKVNGKEANIGTTTPVGKYEAGKSVYGVYDMSGNVREWTDSWHDDNKIYRVVRGGGYIDDEDSVFTFTTRKSIPEDVKDYVGFRCAK